MAWFRICVSGIEPQKRTALPISGCYYFFYIFLRNIGNLSGTNPLYFNFTSLCSGRALNIPYLGAEGETRQKMFHVKQFIPNV